eukprot:1905587-Amphidinium_carterae.1
MALGWSGLRLQGRGGRKRAGMADCCITCLASSTGVCSSDFSAKRKMKKRTGLWDRPGQHGAASGVETGATAGEVEKKGLKVDVGAKVDVAGLAGAAQCNGCEGR